jgi:hypothetical protein
MIEEKLHILTREVVFMYRLWWQKISMKKLRYKDRSYPGDPSALVQCAPTVDFLA